MSTFTSRLRLVKPANGSLNNTWGTVFNQQFSDLVDVAIAGHASIDLADADLALTALNGASDTSRNMMLRFTGALTSAKTVTVPPTSKLYFVENATTGGFSFTVTTPSGTGVEVPAGSRALLACDGVNVVNIVDFLVNGSKVGEFEIGYKGIPQNVRSADYTLQLSDSGKHIFHPSTDAATRVWTIPANSAVAFPIGAVVTFVNDEGAGTVLISTASPDVTILAGFGSSGTRTLIPTGVATALKIGATKWIISGTGIS